MATLTTVHLYRTSGLERVAVVSLQASSTHPDAVMVAVARGPARRKLSQARLLGPFHPDEAAARLDEVVRELRDEGFGQPGYPALLEALESQKPRQRALAAARLAWLRASGSVEALLAAAERGGEDLSTIVDALGALGDPRAVPLARAEAARKLLSRRRSGVEALRALGDADGLAEARTRALERLPDTLRSWLGAHEAMDTGTATVQALVDTLAAVPTKDRGLALDTLYDVATPLTVAATRVSLAALDIVQPHVWRYVKSVFKRALLRHDAETFGLLAHRLERVGRTAGAIKADVKSGYDGQTRTTPIFGRRTRHYLNRLAWRYLRRLAAHRPELYVAAAVEVLAHYTTDDEAPPKGDFGAYSACHLLHRILWGASPRYELRQGALRFRLVPGAAPVPTPGAREESYPQLWDTQPQAYLRLLGTSRLIVLHEWALTALVDRHPGVVEAAADQALVALLDAPFAPTVELGLGELRRRFDPSRPDWGLLERLVAGSNERARELGLEWLTATAAVWSRDVDLCARLLVAHDARVREVAARLCVEGLRDAPADARHALAARLLELLRGGEPQEGAHEALAQVARDVLLDELSAFVPLDELLNDLERGSTPLKGVAASALARRNDAAESIDPARLAALAQDELVAVRVAGLALLGRALPRLTDDPYLLLQVAECPWPDARAGAVDLLRQLDLASLTLDALFELVDSSRAEVQALGGELLEKSRGRWDPVVVLARLLEHPAAVMRPFVLAEVTAQLDGDVTRLPAPGPFFRKVLFDLTPSRATKSRTIELLAENGERDADAARLAVPILNDLLRSQTRQDFEEALAALLRIRLAFPDLGGPALATQGGGQ